MYIRYVFEPLIKNYVPQLLIVLYICIHSWRFLEPPLFVCFLTFCSLGSNQISDEGASCSSCSFASEPEPSGAKVSPAIHVLFLFISFGWEIIEPEAEVVDSESICSGNVLVQSTHPGLQPRPQGPPLSYPSVFNYEKDSCSQRPRLFPSSRIYTYLKLLP